MTAIAQWSQVTTTLSPSPRHRSAMALVGLTNQVLLFGGLSSSSQSAPLSDDWLWDGLSGSWTTITGTVPSARFGHAMAGLATSGRVVMFGGSTSSSTGLLSDTWVFNGTSWSSVTATGPTARFEHAMAGDLNRGVAVLFGGYSSAGYRNDTWEFNGTSWVNRTPTTGSPSVRYAHAMAFDPVRNVTVLFGGWNGSTSTLLSDTWEWNGTSWTQRFPTNSPPVRDFAAMTYDEQRGVIILFGGSPGLSDEWTWNGSNWAQQAGPRPTARMGTSMAFDVSNTAPLLFGGITTSTGTTLGDTWMRF